MLTHLEPRGLLKKADENRNPSAHLKPAKQMPSGNDTGNVPGDQKPSSFAFVRLTARVSRLGWERGCAAEAEKTQS